MTSRRGNVVRWMRILSAVVPWLLLSCAKVGAPPGGPEDKTGPTVVEHFPTKDAVKTPRRMTAWMEFSEPVNRASVEAALFLSPDPGQRLRYRWKGRRLELVYLDSLLEDRTYVISVGSQAKDLRGNPVGSSYTIAFSTGNAIDRGEMEGWVAGVDAPQSVTAWAYLMRDSVPDPMSRVADYRLQVDKDGHFHFQYLKAGRYRAFVVQDRNFDGAWNPSAELIGVPPWDVIVNEAIAPWVSFVLSDQDTAAPRIRALRAIHSRQVDVRFTRIVHSIDRMLFCRNGDSLQWLAAIPDTADDRLWHTFPTDSLTDGEWIVATNGVDGHGHVWIDADTLDVRARADTSRPAIMRIEPSAGSMAITVPSAVQLDFSEPIVSDTSFANAFKVWRADSDSVNVVPTRAGSRSILLTPTEPLARGERYTVDVDGRSLRDRSGNTLADTTLSFSFRVFHADSLGSVTGDIRTSRAGQYLVRARRLKDHATIDSVLVMAPGNFSMSELPAGKYLLDVTQDADGDGVPSVGGMNPLSFSEAYLTLTDTIAIRARWEYQTTISWRENP